jgi:hypothetical protein
MFSFATLFSLLSAAPGVISDVEALLQDPAVKSLEQLIAENFTHTTTPGAAAVLEPIAPAKP